MTPLFLRAAAGFGGCLQASVQVKQRGIEETTAAGMADDKFAKRPTLHRNLRFFRNSKKDPATGYAAGSEMLCLNLQAFIFCGPLLIYRSGFPWPKIWPHTRS